MSDPLGQILKVEDCRGQEAIRASIATRFGDVKGLEMSGDDSDIHMRASTWQVGGVMVLSSSSSPYRVRVPGSPPLAFVTPVVGMIGLTTGGRAYEARSGAESLISGNAEFLHVRGNRRSVLASAYILDAGLGRSFGHVMGDEVDLTADRLRRIETAEPDATSLDRLLRFVVNEMEHASASGGQIAEAGLLAQLVTFRLLRLVIGEPSPERPSGPETLRRAEEYLRAHVDGEVSMSDLCRHVGRGMRAIQLAFKRHHGTTPLAFLKRERLEAARRRLASAPEGETIGTIARSHGFSHLARFAEEFRLAYGETPSAFRQRARGAGRTVG